MLPENIHCDICGVGLGDANMHALVYCIPCIEEMEKLGMSPKKYKKHRGLKDSLPVGEG